MDSILGPHLLTDANSKQQDTTSLLKDAEILILYFSASWCGPCRQFTPILTEFYKLADDLGVKIVFISSDQNQESFNEYFTKMPWYAVPHASSGVKNMLASDFRIRGIPSVIVLEGKTGNFITDKGRADIMNVGGKDKEKVKAVIEGWKAVEAVPVEHAKFSEGTGLFEILASIMRSPVFLFFIYYVFRQFMNKNTDDG